MARQPWASGPGEILQHGLSLLSHDSDAHRRLAMLSIDNAVELMIKTFLGLPKRVTGLMISRTKYDEFSESFPKLLDALNEFASDRIDGIDLGEIEWYHRLRNQLYHEGNGLTVEREKVQIYAELARLLFKNLFGYDIEIARNAHAELLGPFIEEWSELEKALMAAWDKQELTTEQRTHLLMTPRQLAERGVIDEETANRISELRSVRNMWVHAAGDSRKNRPPITKEIVDALKSITAMIRTASPRQRQ